MSSLLLLFFIFAICQKLYSFLFFRLHFHDHEDHFFSSLKLYLCLSLSSILSSCFSNQSLDPCQSIPQASSTSRVASKRIYLSRGYFLSFLFFYFPLYLPFFLSILDKFIHDKLRASNQRELTLIKLFKANCQLLFNKKVI